MDAPEKRISYLPTPGLTYDPSDARYWEPAALEAEVQRAFEICHGCRMCFEYCDSFPTLFGRLDQRYDGDVRQLTPDDVQAVMDGCTRSRRWRAPSGSSGRRSSGTSSTLDAP